MSLSDEDAGGRSTSGTQAGCDPAFRDFTRLQAVVASELRQHEIPGAAVGLLCRGRVVFAKGFGTTDLDTCSPVTERTIFQIGSISKLITAVVALVLVEQHEIDLHAPIGRHAEWLDSDLAALTVHQLLNHTAGLKDAGALYGPRLEVSMREALTGWGREYLFTTPGQIFSYSNPGYALVGLVIECVTGRPFANAMEELLFMPLGMQGSTVSAHVESDSVFSAGHASMHQYGSAPALGILADNAAYRPAGYVYSSLHDLGRLLSAILDDGMLDGKQALPPTVLQRLTTMYVRLPGYRERGYGYGLYVDRSGGRHTAGHTGFNAGFGARVCLRVDTRSALIVLTNRQARTLPRSAQIAMEMLEPVRAPQDRAAPRHEERPRATSHGGYEGTYAQGGPPIVVREKAAALWLRSGRTNVLLRCIGTHRFACLLPGHEEPIEVMFAGEQDGRFRYLYMQSHAFRREEPPVVEHA